LKKVISFSLWGDNPKYTVGALKNIDLLPMVYPDWDAYFYVGKTVPDKILYHMEIYDNVKIIHKEENNDWTSMFWRFEAVSEKDSYIIFRDTDSRLNIREKLAVDQWIESGKTFHIMRDHPFHRVPILGGMWGYHNNGKYAVEQMLNKFKTSEATNEYGTDYAFLQKYIYPLALQDSVVHDEFFDQKPFPSSREGLQFVGQVFDENENTVEEHLKALAEHIR